MDLECRLGNQEQAAADQDDIAPGNRVAGDDDERRAQPPEDGQREQQGDAENECEQKPDLARAPARSLIEIGGQKRHEDDVVDAKHDLKRGERNKRRPGVRIGNEREEIVHVLGLPTQKTDHHKVDGYRRKRRCHPCRRIEILRKRHCRERDPHRQRR